MGKVVIVGTGNVGMSYAYAILNQKTNVKELVLIDINYEKAVGEAMDLNHGLSFAPSKIKVKAGNYSDCKDADIVCICAGVNQKPGETRLDLLHKNATIFKSITDEILKNNFKGIFLIASNPVDIMTYVVMKHSNFPKERVIGSGTTLDTARLRYLIGERLDINIKNVHAYVLGEHGDSEFIPWSTAFVGNNKISDFLNIEELEKIALEIKNAAYEIISRKGATYYAIGIALVKITNAILNDENSILTVSAYEEKNDVYIGKPVVINKNGIVKALNMNLNEEEMLKFNKSALILKEEINNLNDIKKPL